MLAAWTWIELAPVSVVLFFVLSTWPEGGQTEILFHAPETTGSAFLAVGAVIRRYV